VLMCESWCFLASCGVFGGKEMTKVVDCERSLVELESFFFFTFYTWTAAFVAPWKLSFHNFVVIFSPPS
jgi:hypothetical protein